MTEIYYENLAKDRKALLWLIQNNTDYKHGIRRPKSRRGLNRLSTKQLVQKLRAYHNDYSRRVSNYVGWLNTVGA
jgi:hypothetical protein